MPTRRAGATVWGNIRDLGATACTTAEGLCHTSTSGATVIGISVGLIAGTRYCFICSTSVMTAQTLSITQGVGSPACGPLPVELLLFAVDS